MERDLLYSELVALEAIDDGSAEISPRDLEQPWASKLFSDVFEKSVLEQDIQKGIIDENRLADNIFFRRHPERKGQKIRTGERDFQKLSAEWLTIRDKIVRPRLRTPGDSSIEAAKNVVGEGIGKPFMKPARIARPEWSLRKGPADAVIGKLKLNDSILVERILQKPGETLSWYGVYSPEGKQGWIRSDGVALDPPEPGADIHYVDGGTDDLLLNIAGRYYKAEDGFKWGEDARYYVMAIAYANKLVNRTSPFINLPNDNEWQIRDRWKTVGVKVGSAIWIPGKPFMQTLASKISSGSITYELWKTVKRIVNKIVDWVKFAAAFIAGLLRGALESVYDLFVGVVDLVKAVWSIIKSILSGSLIQDAKMLYDNIKNLDLSQIASDFLAKWNNEDAWDRGMFRGRVLGYVIAEVIMAFLSFGALTAIKWTGKFAKLGMMLMKIEKVSAFSARIAAKVKALKFPKEVLEYLEKKWKSKFDTPDHKNPKPKKPHVPAPGDAEAFVHKHLLSRVPARDWRTQVRFHNGKEIPKSQILLDSTMPDSYSASRKLAVEVKSHPVYDRLKMLSTIKDQHGGRVMSLPPGTKSWLFWDLRGQNISGSLDDIGRQLRKDLGGSSIYEKIHLITEAGVKEF